MSFMRQHGKTVADGDTARLSPRAYHRITMLGHYAFVVPDIVAPDQLRPRWLDQETPQGGQ
ncbi:MAG: hypothetical protein ACYCOU_22860 [Sulfobacillus sp.]